MKFFLSFLQSSVRHPVPAYDFWLYYIRNGLTEGGHQILECHNVDWAKGLVPMPQADHRRWLTETWEKTLRYIRKNPPDVFLSYLYPQQIDRSALAEISKSGTPCVNFFCDNVREFTAVPKEFAAFDLNWVPEYQALARYKKAGFPHIHLPMPMWVEPSSRKVVPEKAAQVTFIGSGDRQRLLLLQHAISLCPSLPLAVYGGGWASGREQGPQLHPGYSMTDKLLFNGRFIARQGLRAFIRKLQQRFLTDDSSAAIRSHLHGPVSAADYNELLASSMVTLGINRYPSFRFPLHEPDKYSRLRDLEAPMLGACYLTEWAPGIEHLYDIDEDIAVYHHAEDLIDQISRLQKDRSKRLRLKSNGQRRALSEHTIPATIQRIIDRLN